MTNRLLYTIISLLLLVACGGEEKPEYVRTPVIEISFDSFYQDGVRVNFRTINTDAVYAMVLRVDEQAPSAEKIASDGIQAEGKQFFI